MTATISHIPLIEVDRVRHVYTVNGVVKPSVTQVLKSVGIADFSDIPSDRSEAGMARGTAVHKACQLAVDGDLDWDTLDETVFPYASAFWKWKESTGFQPALCEYVAYHHLYDYCGTLDYDGTFPDGTKAVLDLKTGEGKVEDWVGIQLAAYANMLLAPYSYRRIALRLSGEGIYRTREFPIGEFRNDLNLFLSGLNICRWKAARRT